MKKNKSLANILLQKSESELLQLLTDAYAKIAELEARNRKLEREMSKFKTQAKRERQISSSLRGQLQAEQSKVQLLKSTIKTARSQAKAAIKRAEAAEAEVRTVRNILKEVKPKLSREQLFEMYRDSNLARFWQRMMQLHDYDPDKLAEMQEKMSKWSSQKLRDMIRVMGLRSTWYDSDAQWNSTEASGWDERNLYAFIMSY